LEAGNKQAFDGQVRSVDQIMKSQNQRTFLWQISGAGNGNTSSSSNSSSSSSSSVFNDSLQPNGNNNSSGKSPNNNNNVAGHAHNSNGSESANNNGPNNNHSAEHPIDEIAKFASSSDPAGSGNSFELFRSRVTGGEASQESLAGSNALVITVAVGSALLVFNVCIFAALYYQLDRNRKLVATIKTQQQHSKSDKNVS